LVPVLAVTKPIAGAVVILAQRRLVLVQVLLPLEHFEWQEQPLAVLVQER
jgi:hypothetical protein